MGLETVGHFPSHNGEVLSQYLLLNEVVTSTLIRRSQTTTKEEVGDGRLEESSLNGHRKQTK